MSDRREVAIAGGRRYELVEVLTEVGGTSEVVVCVDEEGQRSYMTRSAWRAATDGTPQVTRESTTSEKVALFRSYFRGREDVYATGYASTRTAGKLNYAPSCAHRFERGVCRIARGVKSPCRDCPNQEAAPLTSEVIVRHMQGKEVAGLYVVVDDVCYLMACDFDGADWQAEAAAFRDTCRLHGLDPLVERSRSGNGAHVWVFFEGAISARTVRRAGDVLIAETQRRTGLGSLSSFDRLFPLQEKVGPGSYGNLIALPCQGGARTQGNSVFVDDDFNEVADNMARLSLVRRASEHEIEEIAGLFGDNPTGIASAADTDVTRGAPRLPLASGGSSEALSHLGEGADAGLPDTVRIVLRDGVHITKDALPAEVLDCLRKLAAFVNPDFYRALAQRKPAYLWPSRFLDYGREDEHELVLPRGCMRGAVEVLSNFGIEPIVVDECLEGRALDVTFEGVLKEFQTEPVQTLLAHKEGVLIAPTGFGKSVMGAYAIAERKVSTLVVVPRTSLLEQWREKLDMFLAVANEPDVAYTKKGRRAKRQPGPIGVIGGGSKLFSGNVDVAIAASLVQDKEGVLEADPRVGTYGMVIVDEAQHIPALTFSTLLKSVRARYIYGLTAELTRSDGRHRITPLLLGPVVKEVDMSVQLEEQKMRRLLVARFTGTSGPGSDASFFDLLEHISADEDRNALVVSDALAALERDRCPLILTRRVDHARKLTALIEADSRAADALVLLLIGSDAEAERTRKLERLRAVPNDSRVLVVATDAYLGEGFDFDRFDTLLLAHPISKTTALTQCVGRLHRTREGKTEVFVLDYVDVGIPKFERSWRGRLSKYRRKLGYEMAQEADLALVGIESQDLTTSCILDRKAFAPTVDADLRGARATVVVAATYANETRVAVLAEIFAVAVARGVSVRIYTLAGKVSDEALGQLQEAGVTVELKESVPANFLVIDDHLCLYGDVSPLGFAKKEQLTLRIESAKLASELVGLLG